MIGAGWCQYNEYVLSVSNERVCVVAAGAGRRGGGQQRCPAGGRQQPELWDEPAQPAGQTVDRPHRRRVPRVGVDALTGGQRLGHAGQNHGSTQITFIVNHSKQQVELSQMVILLMPPDQRIILLKTLDQSVILWTTPYQRVILLQTPDQRVILLKTRPKG